MKLQPITRNDTFEAVNLLAEGFPALSAATWQNSLEKIFAYVEDDGGDSIGAIAHAGGKAVGICLTIPVTRTAYTSPSRRLVNIAAFYIRPGNEWMTTLFLRRLMCDASVDYVDLTASKTMRQVNRKLGFRDLSAGMVIVPLIAAAWRRGAATRIIPFEKLSPRDFSADHHALLEAHAKLDRIAIGIEYDGGVHPLILTQTLRKGVPGARIVLARDRKLVRAALGPLARRLLVRGYAFIDFEAASKDGFPEALFWTNSPPVQATGDWRTDSIDHTFSELIFIPPVGLLNGR